MPDESFVEKMVHRLVRKHIAGTTMGSALSKAEEFNSKKMLTSITFLSPNVDNKSKARYVTITYMELVRRISRLGLKASIHVPVEQCGIMIDQDAGLKNLDDIISTGNKFGVFVWVEVPDANNAATKDLNGTKGYGFAFPEEHVRDFSFLSKENKPAKMIFKENQQHHTKVKATSIGPLAKSLPGLVVSSPPDSLARELIRNPKYKGITLEFSLGSDKKNLKSALKRGANVSISVPFGKDWTQFAMEKVPESYMRFLATNLLSEKKSTSSA